MRASPITIVPYDPDWPTRYEKERRALERAFRGSGATIEHVGSTAVPGLGAKPILDIMVGVSDLAKVEARIADLEAAGYEYVSEYETDLLDRRYFRKPRTGARRLHLHCVRLGGGFWIRHLLFRDHLRENPDVARAYFELKLDLASRFRLDRTAYLEGKTPFIESVLAIAVAESD